MPITVLAGALAEEVDYLRLGHLARNVEVAGQPVLGGDWGKKVVHRTQTKRFEHGLAISGRFGQISHRKLLDAAHCPSDSGFRNSHPSKPAMGGAASILFGVSSQSINVQPLLRRTFRNRRLTAILRPRS